MRNVLVRLALAAIPLTAIAPAFGDGLHQLKAAFIYNFARFIQFPADSLPDGRPLVVGIEGDDGYGRDLSAALEKKSVSGHPFEIRRVRNREDMKTCQFIVVGEAGADSIRRVIKMTQGLPVVTIGDGTDFVKLGGTIGFVQSDDRIRFDVSLQAAKSAGVTVSSHMLELARRVVRD